MALSRRSSLILVRSFSLVAAFFVFSASARAAQTDTSTRITAATNVTLRMTPSPDGAPVAQLPLGTEVAESGPAGLEKTWIRVRLADSREGWIQTSLTRPLDSIWRWPVFDHIITERLGRKGDGFAATAELLAFIERVAPEYTDPDGRGRIELARLRALAATLRNVPMNGARRELYSTWLTSHKEEVIYDEPGGHWMITDEAIWKSHARYAGTKSADEIAWFAVRNGLPGECEGYVPCYIGANNRLYGEYLRRHPAGAHAQEAVAWIKGTADLLVAPVKAGSAYEFDPKRDCKDLTSAIDALASAIQKTRVESRDAALASLGSLRKVCDR